VVLGIQAILIVDHLRTVKSSPFTFVVMNVPVTKKLFLKRCIDNDYTKLKANNTQHENLNGLIV